MMAFVFFLVFIYTQDNFSQSTLYYNANIFTADSKKPFIGYFVSEDGKISETGDTIASERISQFENKVDLHGKTVIPGIVDSHIHFIDGSLGLLQISLSEVVNSEELRNKIKATSSQLLDGFYVARDLGFTALSGIESPRNFLDSLLPDSPAIIFFKKWSCCSSQYCRIKKTWIY